MHTISTQLAKARAELEKVSGVNAALEARLLAGHAWRMSPEELVFHGAEARDPATFWQLIERRLKAEPVAHILGERHFWRDVFKVNRAVLTPRPDSETIIEALLRARPDNTAALKMLDLGTGSGCLILSALREYTKASGVAIDQSQHALDVATQNAESLGLSPRCRMMRGDWCTSLGGTFFDVLISNPPYIRTDDIAGLQLDVRGFEPHAALDGGADGLDCYRDIIAQAPPHLNTNALVLFEVGEGQAADVAALGEAAGWTVKEIAKDLAGIDRVVVFETK